MNISDGKRNFTPKLFFVEFHSNNFVGKSFVKKAIDLGTSRQLQSVDSRRTTTLDATLKILLQLLYAPVILNCKVSYCFTE